MRVSGMGFRMWWIFTLGLFTSFLVAGGSSAGLLQQDPYEPNDTLETATRVELPFHAEGLSISPPDDLDVFTFQLEQPALVDIDVDAEVLGSPLDGVLTLLDAKGKRIDYSNDADGRDPHLRGVLKPGRYYVVIQSHLRMTWGPYNLRVLHVRSECVKGELKPQGSELWSLGMLAPKTVVVITLEGPEDADFILILHEVISTNPLVTLFVRISREVVEYEVPGSVPKEYIVEVTSIEGEGAYTLCKFISAP